MERAELVVACLRWLSSSHPGWLERLPLALQAKLKQRKPGRPSKKAQPLHLFEQELAQDASPAHTFQRLLQELDAMDFGRAEEGKIEVLTNQAAQAVDRASRGSGWQVNAEQQPFYTDYRGNLVRYHEVGVDLDALRQQLTRMTPRTADVWRLITAKALSQWSDDASEPDSVWVDIRELVTAMGYRRKTKGEYNPEALLQAAQAVTDLNRLYLSLSLGTMELPLDPKSGKRKATKVEAIRERKVLNVEERDTVRVVSSGESYHLRWRIRLGPWIKNYPKQFVPMQRKLVELPARGSDAWAKVTGMELLFFLREGANKSEGDIRRIRVQTLLERSGLWDDAQKFQENRNGRRVQEYLEKALDTLKSHAVILAWEYDPSSEWRFPEDRQFPGLALYAETVLVIRFPELLLGSKSSPIPLSN
ncbi:MAG: hypothetical protein IVW51_14390 [Thermaceae bacterium]|nr:hypothetical protein [Thermaceae bacterium]